MIYQISSFFVSWC